MVRTAQQPRFAGSAAHMRIGLPATRSSPCLDARSRGSATIANPGESFGGVSVSWGGAGRWGRGPPGASGARRERQRPEARDRSGIAGSASERQLERRARAGGIAIIAKHPAGKRPRPCRPGPVNLLLLALPNRAPRPRPRQRAAGPQGRLLAGAQKNGRRARRRPFGRKRGLGGIRTGFPDPCRWRVRGRSRPGRR